MSDQIECNYCGRDMRIIAKKVRTDGLLATKYRCRNSRCLHNTTVLSGKKTGPIHRKPGKLSPDDVFRILTSDEPVLKMAASIGCHRQTVSDVRSGRLYRHCHPELERPGSYKKHLEVNSCNACIHWLNRCTMDFPEGQTGSFANLCTCFTKKQLGSVADGIGRSASAVTMKEETVV